MLIRLPVTGHTMQWSVMHADGVQRSGEGDLPVQYLMNSVITLLVPSGQLIFQAVPLRRITAQALRWALEPLALSDPGELHLTLLCTEKHVHHIAAADAREMSQWLSIMADKGIDVARMLPDICGLSPGERVLTGKEWVVRDRPWQGYSVSDQKLDGLLAFRPLPADCVTLNGGLSALQRAASCRLNMLHGKFAGHRSGGGGTGWYAGITAGLIALTLVAWPWFNGGISLYNSWCYERQADSIYASLYHVPRENVARTVLQKGADRPLPPLLTTTSLLSALMREKAVIGGLGASVSSVKWSADVRRLDIFLRDPGSLDIPPQRAGAEYSLSEDKKILSVTFQP